jgi:hypothetical protein
MISALERGKLCLVHSSVLLVVSLKAMSLSLVARGQVQCSPLQQCLAGEFQVSHPLGARPKAGARACGRVPSCQVGHTRFPQRALPLKPYCFCDL